LLVESLGTEFVPDSQKMLFRNTILGPLVDRLPILQPKGSPQLLDGTKKMDSLGLRNHG